MEPDRLHEEEQWVRRLRSDGAERDGAIAELRDVLVRGLHRSLGQEYGGYALVEDVAQEALLKILKSLDTFAGRSRFTTWAMAIATRIGISELRRRRYKDISLDVVTAGGGLPLEATADPSKSVETKTELHSILGTLQQLINESLTDRQRIAMRGVLEGLPVEEIARKTGSNRNAVYKLVHDAREKLKQGFARAGISADDIQSVLS